MRCRASSGSVLVVLSALLLPQTSGAQPSVPTQGLPSNRPAVSPYLNLTRPGGSAAFNYATLVRPQFNTLNAVQRLNQEIQQNQQAINRVQNQAEGLVTGHATAFGNHGAFFLTNQGGISPAGRGAVTTGLPLGPRPGRFHGRF